MEFKEVLKEILADTGLSQAEFAKKLGIHQGHLSNWMRGLNVPNYWHLQNICTKLNISGDRILGLKE